jgi:Polysaccharide deacetylase
MDCQAPARRSRAEARPKTWEDSARAIESFCDVLSAAGHPATLFVSHACAEEHEPLLGELAGRGVEVGLLLNPHDLDGKRYGGYLGTYDPARQREIAALAVERFRGALGVRPVSVRSAEFSASSETFAVLGAAGFRQGSLSNPGRTVPKYGANWAAAEADPHEVGQSRFLEIPVTSDASQSRGGVSPDLSVERGDVDEWHRPLAEAQLRRMEAAGVAFPALCLYTANGYPYHDPSDRCSRNLHDLLDYVEGLRTRYEVVPATAAEAHRRFTEARTD